MEETQVLEGAEKWSTSKLGSQRGGGGGESDLQDKKNLKKLVWPGEGTIEQEETEGLNLT